MQKNKLSGFTIIELIVVIAIIAVLAAIVTNAVTKYINKAKDEQIKANLAQWAKKAQISFGETGSYTNPIPINTKNPCDYDYTFSPNAEGNAFAVFSPLCSNSNDYWCVDSTGKSVKFSGGPLDPEETACGEGARSCHGTCYDCASQGDEFNCTAVSPINEFCTWNGYECVSLEKNNCFGENESACESYCGGCKWGF